MPDYTKMNAAELEEAYRGLCAEEAAIQVEKRALARVREVQVDAAVIASRAAAVEPEVRAEILRAAEAQGGN